MPLPRGLKPTEAQLTARKSAIAEAMAMGVKQRHELELVYGLDNMTLKFEGICFTGGNVTGPDYKPTTVVEWVAGCKRRNVIPFVPNV
jgi:hypothetical protein